jgi:hypothetical protein
MARLAQRALKRHVAARVVASYDHLYRLRSARLLGTSLAPFHRRFAMAQQLCLRGALRPVARRGSVAVRAPPARHAPGQPARCRRAVRPAPAAAAAEHAWRRERAAAKHASLALMRLPISPSLSAGLAAGLCWLARSAGVRARVAGARRRGAARGGAAHSVPRQRCTPVLGA